jgi:hypothetical protein
VHSSRFITILLTAFTLLLPSAALSQAWDQAIAKVEVMAEDFWRISREKGFTQPLGTTFNEVDVSMHLCAILGRMVGHKNSIAHLEPPQPGYGATGREFAIASTSLRNWVIAARYHATLSDDQTRRLWNLDCVGKMDIPPSLAVPVPLGHDVVYDESRGAIMIQGDITIGFSQTVKEALTTYPEARVVSLGSGGGAVYEAMRAGLPIRQAGLETELVNSCYSACPLVLAAGTLRFMWSPLREEVGLHQVSNYGVAVQNDNNVYRDITQYLDLMGVDAALFITGMLSASPEDMFLVEEALRCRMRIITNHQRGCLALD